jgi:hypothetical protein
MSVAPTDFAVRPDQASPRGAGTLGAQWAALQETADAVAAIAGLAAEKPTALMRAFPDRIADVGGWRLELASNGIADIAAMMSPGVKALLAVSARGQDPTPAALTLWHEFHAARDALLALVPEE